jgi:hypothetical protein
MKPFCIINSVLILAENQQVVFTIVPADQDSQANEVFIFSFPPETDMV